MYVYANSNANANVVYAYVYVYVYVNQEIPDLKVLISGVGCWYYVFGQTLKFALTEFHG